MHIWFLCFLFNTQCGKDSYNILAESDVITINSPVTSAPTLETNPATTSTPTKAPTSVPTKESSNNCRDDPDFHYRNKENMSCDKLPTKLCNKWDRVTKKLVKARCPVQCGYCNDPERCINPTEKIPLKVGHRRGQVKVSCDIIPIVPLVECTDIINRKNISDFCPGSCNLCNQW